LRDRAPKASDILHVRPIALSAHKVLVSLTPFPALRQGKRVFPVMEMRMNGEFRHQRTV